MATTSPSLDAHGSEELVVRIVDAVAASSGVDPLTLPPLGRVVDIEAIDSLVGGDGLCDLTFAYHDHWVTVDGDGHVRVSPVDQ